MAVRKSLTRDAIAGHSIHRKNFITQF